MVFNPLIPKVPKDQFLKELEEAYKKEGRKINFKDAEFEAQAAYSRLISSKMGSIAKKSNITKEDIKSVIVKVMVV